jgi:hypothetical protein
MKFGVFVIWCVCYLVCLSFGVFVIWCVCYLVCLLFGVFVIRCVCYLQKVAQQTARFTLHTS